MENIFDAAGKNLSSHKGKPYPRKIQNIAHEKSNKDFGSEEVNEMLQKMHKMKKDLEDQLAEVYEKGKVSKIDVSLLVENASNLTAKQLEKMEEQERILKEKILKITPPESCIRKNPKSKEKLTQDRKGKLRGARNNWIPVR